MGKLTLDELRALERRTSPAWLLDVKRLRVVWANRAGLAFWGEATVLDLIDRRFNVGDEAMGRLAELAEGLAPDASSVENLVFDIGGAASALRANCTRNELEDGRTALLVVGTTEHDASPEPRDARNELLEAVVSELPVPVVVFDRHGSLLYQNRSAETSLSMDGVEGAGSRDPDGSMGLLASWLGNETRADELISQSLLRGGVSVTENLHTRFGARAHRIDTRRIAAPVIGQLAVLFVLEDIEDRRRYERRHFDTSGAVDAILGAVDATFELDAEGRLLEFGGLAEDVFGTGIGVLIGCPWGDVIAALEVESAVPFAVRLDKREPWREILAGTAKQSRALAVSAAPNFHATGGLAGFSGLILALGANADESIKTGGIATASDLDRVALSDTDEFLLDAGREAIGEGEPDLEGETKRGEEEKSDPAVSSKENGGRDDAATFSAIARALDVGRSQSDSATKEPAAGGATLRVVGGVEAARKSPAPDSVPDDYHLPAGQPALIHRHFAILNANERLSGMLGYPSLDALMKDNNLLNLLPDERARLFSLQSRFDDRDVPPSGKIDGVSLKLRRQDRRSIATQAILDEVVHAGETAIRIVFDAGEAVEDIEPLPAVEMEADAVSSPSSRIRDRLEQPTPAKILDDVGSEALSASVAREAELRAVINTAADGIATLDSEGRIVTLNSSAEAIFGVAAPDAVSRKFSELFMGNGGQKIEAYLSSVTANDSARLYREGHEVAGKSAEGSEIPLFVTIGRMKVENGSRFCAVIRDISQWKETEEGLRLAKERAEEDSSKKSDFLARISHELRTPLNAIIGFSEVMSEEKFGPIANDRYKGYLNDIRSSGGHLLSLINDLLDLSKIEAGKLDLNFTGVDISRLIEQGVAIIQPQANQSKVIVRVSLPEQLPSVVADERSVRQIVLNLLSNAVKFTPAGGQVILSALVDEQGCLQVRVRDTGIGMSKDEIVRAMEPFRQIEALGQTDHAGTGLGLPLTKALTEANRAEFRIESTPSAGTLVQITFPTNRVLDG